MHDFPSESFAETFQLKKKWNVIFALFPVWINLLGTLIQSDVIVKGHDQFLEFKLGNIFIVGSEQYPLITVSLVCWTWLQFLTYFQHLPKYWNAQDFFRQVFISCLSISLFPSSYQKVKAKCLHSKWFGHFWISLLCKRMWNIYDHLTFLWHFFRHNIYINLQKYSRFPAQKLCRVSSGEV